MPARSDRARLDRSHQIRTETFAAAGSDPGNRSVWGALSSSWSTVEAVPLRAFSTLLESESERLASALSWQAKVNGATFFQPRMQTGVARNLALTAPPELRNQGLHGPRQETDQPSPTGPRARARPAGLGSGY